MSTRTALVVRGGWEGHDPVGCTEVFIPFLEAQGFEVAVAEDLSVYDEARRIAATDLVVHSWSGGMLTSAQEANLVSAVRHGTGLAGWHGGIIGTNVANAAYLRMVGGRFLHHPEGFQDYTVNISRSPVRDGEIVEGLDDYRVLTEQYWVLSDSASTVLATTTFAVEDGGEWAEPAIMPVTWTRRWGAGRVFVCTLGHQASDLRQLPTTTMIERGLLWASRPDRPERHRP